MTKNILLIFFLFIGFSVSAQMSIELDPPTVHGSGGVDEQEIKVYVDVTNTSDVPLKLLWTRHEVEKPDVWWTWICDLQACYTWNIGQAPASRTNDLRPGETMELQIHAKAFGVAGAATIDIDLYDASDTSNILGTARATIEAGTSSTSDVFETEKIRVYPNPTSDYFRIFQSEGIQHIEVYNMIGKRVREYNASTEGQYNVSNLPEGMYLVRMLDRQNSVVKTVRLSKK